MFSSFVFFDTFYTLGYLENLVYRYTPYKPDIPCIHT